MHLHNGIYFVITCATSYGSDVEVEICTTSSPHLFFCIDKKSFFLFCWTWFDLKATGFFSRYDDHRRKKKDFHISKNSADTKKMDPHLFDAARASFFARNHTSFLTAGFQSLLTTYLPQIIQQHCTITTLINGLLYTYSITNIKAYNSGITPSHCFRHILSQRVPMVGDFKLTVAPLLADLQTHKPVVMSKVRGVVFLQPICTGATLLTTPVTLDKEILNQTLPDGILISRGKMRTIPCVKAMFTNMILLIEKKKFYKVQVRSNHDGNKTLEEGNPFRSTSSIEFIVPKKKLKRVVSEGVIMCKLPFSKHEIHIGVVAQAFGCEPARFVELIRCIAGTDYDAATFRPYEISILHNKSVQEIQTQSREKRISLQNAAILILSKLSGKDVMAPGVNLLKTEVFPHLNVMCEKNDNVRLYFYKLLMLGVCITMLILFIAGKLPETSRDLWRYANMQMPAWQLGTLVRTKLVKHVSMIMKLLRRELIRIQKKAPQERHYLDLLKVWGGHRLSFRIDQAVLTGRFSKRKVGVSIPLNDNNEDAMWTQLLRMVSSMSTTDSVNTNPRKLQKDGYGYSCAGATPDGPQVGLTSELACTATITTEVEDPRAIAELIAILLKDYLMDVISSLLVNDPEAPTPPPSATVFTNSLEEEVSASVELVRKLHFDKLQPTWYLFINNCGIPTHFVRSEDVNHVVRIFRDMRRSGVIYKHAFISVSHQPRQIRILCEGGQLTRPLIVLENIHRANPTMSFQDMEHLGIIEWVTPAEEQSICKVAICVEDLRHAISRNEHKQITHLEFTQASFVGFLAGTVVYLSGQQGPRLALYHHQKKQVITGMPKVYRGSVMSMETWYPHSDLIFTELGKLVHGAKDGRGTPCVTAILTDQRDQEDAIVIQKQALQRGLHLASSTRHYVSDVEPPHNGMMQKFEKPHDVFSKKNLRYDALEEDGFPRKKRRIDEDCVVIGKTRTTRKTNANSDNNANNNNSANATGGSGNTNTTRFSGAYKRCISQVTPRNEGGQVIEVEKQPTPFGTRAHVAVVTTRPTELGDKFSTDKAQKGVAGQIRSIEDMPFCPLTGQVPEIIVSAVGQVGRMTMSTKCEGVISNAVAAEGDVEHLAMDPHDYSNPETKRRKLKEAGDILVKAGWQRTGATYLCNGSTGERSRCEVFMGMIKYERLVHLASNKLNFCAEGPRCPLTRQPRQGKRKKGGLRFGEGEEAAALAQGAAYLIQSRLRDLSDLFEIFVCNQCKCLADGNKLTNYAWCRTCERRDSVHIVKVPFSFLLNSYELMTMGISTKLGTRTVKPPLCLTYNPVTSASSS